MTQGETGGLRRRELLAWTGAALAAGTLGACAARLAPQGSTGGGREATGGAGTPAGRDGVAARAAAEFHAARRFAELPCGRIAYVERGRGEAALFLHGAPLNGFQWRGVLERLAGLRRCIAPDFMGLGYSEVPERQGLAAGAQVEMLLALLDALGVATADVVASDSGTAVAQLLAARRPDRVRTLLLTNGDVEPDSPPVRIQPVLAMARAGTLADATARWLTDTSVARATFGAAVFHDPAGFADATIRVYVAPLVGTPLRRRQYEAYHVALEPNPLAGVTPALARCPAPLRVVWGTSDEVFGIADAEYLVRTLPRSRGIRRVADGKLFFQEEFPEVIAEEAAALWRSA